MIYVASTERTKLQPQGIRAGRITAPASIPVPGGTWHAVDVEAAQQSLCGLPAGSLIHWKEQPFWRGITGGRCRECSQLAPPAE